jgi:NTE family protein
MPRLAPLLLLLALTACISAPPGNPPLPPGARNTGWELIDLNFAEGRSDMLVMLAFSGGGMRSAAFAHGALRGLRETMVPGRAGPTRLLDEVDQISAVSGGSFPAAHYALHREASFASFPDAFLRQDVESYIWGTFLLPWNWAWIASPSVGTNDRMAAVYDRLLFQGATYRDLIARGRPRLLVGATELVTGVNFPFLPYPFDLICSELGAMPLARAVAASSAFPLLFTPITLDNHRGQGCDAPLPPAPIPESLRDERVRQLEQVMRRIGDPERTRFVHLMDGGIADNLALRYITLSIAAGGERGERYEERVRPIRRILVLVVDGQAATDPELALRRQVYGLGTILNAVSGGQIDNYNIETLAVAQQELASVSARAAEWRCAHARVIAGYRCDDTDAAVVRVSLANHPDPALRARLQAIRTGLALRPEDAALLVEAGERAVRESAELRAFLDGVERPAPRIAAARQAPRAAGAATAGR